MLLSAGMNIKLIIIHKKNSFLYFPAFVLSNNINFSRINFFCQASEPHFNDDPFYSFVFP